jgi:hypothetical protein
VEVSEAIRANIDIAVDKARDANMSKEVDKELK